MDTNRLRELIEAASNCTGALCAGVARADAESPEQVAGDADLAARVAASAAVRSAVTAGSHRCIPASDVPELATVVGYVVLSPVEVREGDFRMLLVAGAPAEEADSASALLRTLTGMTLSELRVLSQALPRDQAMEASLCGITIADAGRPDLPLVYVNRTFCEMTGYPPEDLLGRNCRLLQGDDRDQPGRHEMAAAVAAGRECTVELRNYRRDGSVFDNHIRLIPVTGDDGRLLHYIGVQLDVSDRRALRELVGEQADEFKRILDLSGAGALLLDADSGHVVFVNRAGAELFGRSAVSLLEYPGQALLGIAPSEICAAPEWLSLTVERADGGVRHVQSNAIATEWDGRPLLLITLVDVTQRERTAEALRATNYLLDHAPDAVFWTRRDGGFAYVNQTAAAKLGYDRAELMSLTVPDIDAEARADPAFWRRHWASTEAQREYLFRSWHLRRDGRRFPVEVHGKVMTYAGEPLRASFVRDISERLEAEHRLRQAARVIASTDEGVMITDDQVRIVSVNPAFTRITGYSEAEVLGRNPRLLSSGHHGHEFYEQMWSALRRTDHWQGELWNRRKSGEIYPEWLTINAVRDEDGALVNYAGVFSDLTRIKRSEAELEHLAEHDSLTDLPNRTSLLRHLDGAIEHARRSGTTVALLLCDVDRFAKFNDSLGHPLADRVLCAVGERIRAALPAGAFLARPGGDQFAVVLASERTDVPAVRVAERLVASGSEPIRLPDGEAVFADLTVGTSHFPEDAEDATGLLQDADAALQHTKATARGSYGFFTPELTAAARRKLSTETELRYAIDNAELVLHYHPLVAVDSGEVRGAEALVRWPRADGSLVPPDRFIPLAEETGLILPLGRWVLREACRQARAWQRAGLTGLVMAVNVSARQLRATGFLAELDDALAETGLAAECLELEITETVLMEQVETALPVIDGIHARGIGLAIDDFGTGYSSLAYLKRFGAQKLKIDRTFVRDLPGDEDGAQIAASVIAMGHNLRMEVLAEGVENVVQLEFLKARGCDWFQGFWVSPPVPASAFPALAAARYGAGRGDEH